MAPFAVAMKPKSWRSIAGKLEGRKAELAKWEDEQNPPLSIARHGVNFSPRPIARTAATPRFGNMNFNGKPLPIG